MGAVWSLIKQLSRRVWFRRNKSRRCFIGPYAGLTFQMSTQLLDTRMIVFYRAYEPEVTSFMSQIIRPGMVIVDVGAHIGIHALYAAKLLQRSGLVYAFEPCPENYQALAKNITHNRSVTAEILPIKKAVGSRCGVADFTLGATDGTHHLTESGEAPTLKVEITTLDNFFSQTQHQPDLILADVEGEELSLLQGAKRLVREQKPGFILEHHGSLRREQIKRWFRDGGYRVSEIGGRHLYAESES